MPLWDDEEDRRLRKLPPEVLVEAKDPNVLPQDKKKTNDCSSCGYKRRLSSRWHGSRLESGGKCCYLGVCKRQGWKE